MRSLLVITFSVMMQAMPALAQRSYPADWPVYTPPAVAELRAEETLRIEAREAGQGAAAGGGYVYAVGNFVIAKYRRDNGQQIALWRGEREGLIGHLNSCYADDDELWCANSNHPRDF